MKKIGGNITATIQVCSSSVNIIGEAVKQWNDALTVKGFLDLVGEDTDISSFKTKLPQSTHVFVSDFFPLNNITVENSRLVIGGNIYEILLIDDPMALSQQYEFYLKQKGGL